MNRGDFPVEKFSTEVLVIGGGIAAVQAALAAHQSRAKVRLVTKKRLLTGGASAVGRSEIMGVAAALGHTEPEDSPQVHYQDTINAGGLFCRSDLVRVLVEEIPREIRDLLALGVPFERRGEKLFQTGSDYATYPRNCHADGRTGYEILAVLVPRVKRAGIEIDEEVMVAKLYRGPEQSLGAFGLGMKSNAVYLYEAKTVVVACGGAGHLFSHHAVSPEMSGDGYLIALEAGAPLINMEFLQFGPGLLGPRPFALSGPIYRLGPRFINSKGEDILKKHLPASLSSEEVLAQKIFPFNAENASRYLDIAIFQEKSEGHSVRVQFEDAAELLRRIPHTSRRILDSGFSLTDPWPVGLLLQCFNGGVYMEDNRCRTKVPGLFVAGEAAGGLRAPTRPGGNALAEALVFGRRAGAEAAREVGDKPLALAKEEEVQSFFGDLMKIHSLRQGRSHLQIRREIQGLSEKYLSVVRWAEGLREARDKIQDLRNELETEGQNDGFPADFLTTRHLAAVAEVVAVAAAKREETRGSHYRKDFEKRREEMNLPFFIFRDGQKIHAEGRGI